SPDQDLQDIHSKATRLNDAQVITVGTQLLFDEGSWELSQQMRRVLTQQVLPQIKGKRNKVMVRGHAYGEGDRSGRRSLMDMSFRRANAVSDFLVSQGANPLAIVLHAAGDTEPRVIPTSFAESVDRNRRVELLLSEITIDQMHPDPDGTGRTR
ncbi:MAG: OmpA family protein, partial [Planctomycetota bacterium]